MKLIIIAAFAIAYACGASETAQNSAPVPSVPAASPSDTAFSAAGKSQGDEQAPNSAAGPQNVKDFFMLLPEEYFTLEGCEREKDKNCKNARESYLKEFAEVDIANGYIKGGCDGAQACIEMAIFKKPDGSYLVGLATFMEMMNNYRFAEYVGGKWKDVSSEVVPEFSKKNMYEIPRRGTTVQVFAKKIVEQGPDFEASEKGPKLYDLVWKDGKFSIKK